MSELSAMKSRQFCLVSLTFWWPSIYRYSSGAWECVLRKQNYFVLSFLLKTEHCWVSKCKFLPKKKKKKKKGFLIFGKSEFALEELEWRQGLRWGVQRPAADKALPSYTLSVNLWALLSEEAVVWWSVHNASWVDGSILSPEGMVLVLGLLKSQG